MFFKKKIYIDTVWNIIDINDKTTWPPFNEEIYVDLRGFGIKKVTLINKHKDEIMKEHGTYKFEPKHDPWLEDDEALYSLDLANSWSTINNRHTYK